jgi:hypothetical protein
MYNLAIFERWKEINFPNIRIFSMDISFLLPDDLKLMDIRTENTDVREVDFHPPVFEFCQTFLPYTALIICCCRDNGQLQKGNHHMSP